jgi:hypothetical protein
MKICIEKNINIIDVQNIIKIFGVENNVFSNFVEEDLSF